jgi:hypothetical protein
MAVSTGPVKVVLTSDEVQYVNEYMRHMNGMDAALAMGYDELIAFDVAKDYAERPHIREAIQERTSECHLPEVSITPKDYGITEGYIMVRLKNIADRGEHKNALKALELLGKHIGMFKEKETKIYTINSFAAEDRQKAIEALKARGVLNEQSRS